MEEGGALRASASQFYRPAGCFTCLPRGLSSFGPTARKVETRLTWKPEDQNASRGIVNPAQGFGYSKLRVGARRGARSRFLAGQRACLLRNTWESWGR